MQPSDTAYPRFKSRLAQSELERFYTMTDVELAYCDSATRSNTTRLGFSLLLKTYQRLGYFVTSEQVPSAIAEHVASSMGEPYDRENLRQYDVSQARRKHLSAIRQFLAVKPFDDDGKVLMRQIFSEAALTKEDVIDIVNIGIETLVRHRYELPAFDTLLREARAERIATNQVLHTQVHDALGDAVRIFLDKLFVVGDDPRRVSPWNDIKQDTAKPTIDGMRDLVKRLVTGEIKRDTVPTRINRRQFEACLCFQMVGELKSGDLCVIGSDAYSDHRNERCRWRNASARARIMARK